MNELIEKLIRRHGIKSLWIGNYRKESAEIRDFIEELAKNNEMVKPLEELFSYMANRLDDLEDKINRVEFPDRDY